jgi:hypothetical protein
MRAHLFLPIIPDIDQWLLKFELIRLPGNLVGHMNFLNVYDDNQISAAHREIPQLIAAVQNYQLPLLIP